MNCSILIQVDFYRLDRNANFCVLRDRVILLLGIQKEEFYDDRRVHVWIVQMSVATEKLVELGCRHVIDDFELLDRRCKSLPIKFI